MLLFGSRMLLYWQHCCTIHSFLSFVSLLRLMLYVSSVLLSSLIFYDPACFWICVFFVIWIVFFSWTDDLSLFFKDNDIAYDWIKFFFPCFGKFKNILNKIEPGSVIVLDNAPYHSRQIERVPNMSWRKADIQAWLQRNEISFDNKEIKAELLTKFKREDYNKKAVDVMAAEKNIITLRLPPYHCELNPIELIWAQLKSYVGKNNKTFKMAEVETLTREGLERIGAASWEKCIEHIIKEEDKMMMLDGIMDTAHDALTPPFVINTGNSSSSESDEDDESDDETY